MEFLSASHNNGKAREMCTMRGILEVSTVWDRVLPKVTAKSTARGRIRMHLRPHSTLMVVSSLSCVQLFVTSWTIACLAPLSMGFPRQEYWSGLPFLSPEDLPDPGIEPWSPTLQADSLPTEL